ncbi:MAG: rhamnulokinase [Clostridia bacterium]|nr:rhamnulokinase [Clostridia bacterium]
MPTYYLAIDLGASSGRHILSHIEDGKIVLEEMYRFDNIQIRKNDCDCWNLEELYLNILGGLKVCAEAGKIPSYIGIDTWAVDYVLLDESDQICCHPVAYRDKRTNGMDEKVSEIISPKELYAKTGIQKQIFNTIYQLMAQKEYHPEEMLRAKIFLMIPDYLNFRLTGKMVNEYTNASSTNLVNAHTKMWDVKLIEQLGLPTGMFKTLKMPGTIVGDLTESVQKSVGFNCKVILPATHDTGSAFLAVPARDDNAVYLSSGTWSLLGVENKEPITTEESRLQNFTNEGGYDYRFRYLKNIMGLWMIQSIRRELNGVDYVEGKGAARQRTKVQIGFGELSEAARNASDFYSIVDVNDDRFLSPNSMIEEIKKACADTGQPIPNSVGEVMQCVYLSLSKCYADAIEKLSGLTGKIYTSINIVGGGCQDMYLNEMTAKATGLPVYAGPIEGTALGNLMVQMIYAGEFQNLQEARNAIKNSFDIKEIQ